MLQVGTDCSGIEAPIQALKNMNIEFEHVFSCEIDEFARKSILANYNPKVLYEDITKEKQNHKLDLYVSGFPCQPFSLAGRRTGTNDPRGNVFDYCIKNIKNTDTNVFILENVKGIISINNGEYWKYITSELESLKDYNVHYNVLNTKNYGIPQNRPRLYIVGIKKQIQKKEFKFPEYKPLKNIKDYVDTSTTNKDREPIKNEEIMNTLRNSKATFLNLAFRNFKEHSYEYFSGCITISGKHWCVPMHRKATIKELLLLQGFPVDFKQVVSYTQMKKQIGNSMSVNVLECLLKEIFSVI